MEIEKTSLNDFGHKLYVGLVISVKRVGQVDNNVTDNCTSVDSVQCQTFTKHYRIGSNRFQSQVTTFVFDKNYNHCLSLNHVS